MGMPVKLSNELVKAARAEAAAADRTITSQIEHWATLGRAVEASLPHRDVLVLKASSESGHEMGSVSPSLGQSLRNLLESIAKSPNRSTVLAELKASRRTVYESVPDHPDRVVSIEPDGRRTLGRFVGRRFVPEATSGGGRR